MKNSNTGNYTANSSWHPNKENFEKAIKKWTQELDNISKLPSSEHRKKLMLEHLSNEPFLTGGA